MANKPTLTLADNNGKCRVCKTRVVDPTLCPGCSAPYHPSCATSKTTLIPGVGYARCCGARPPSPAVQVSDNNIIEFIRQELKDHRESLSKEFSTVKDSVASMTEDFKAFGIRLTSAEADLSEVVKRVDGVEGKVLELQQRPDNSSISMADCLCEWEERHKRKNNIMIFGLREPRGVGMREDRDADSASIAEFMSLILPGAADMGSIKSFRIGKFSQALTTPRPVKVILPSAEMATSAIRAVSANKDTIFMREAYESVRVTSDRTNMQLKEYKDLKRTLDSRLSQGQAGLRIRYRNGIPRTVQEPPQQ